MVGFSCKTKIICASLEFLQTLGIKRLLLVTDPFFAENGTAGRFQKLCEVLEVFSQVKPDPTAELVATGAARVKSFLPDAVVALGGGSAMDCAKAMLYFSGTEARLIAIPTTSGSGSEVTNFAVITKGEVKYPLVDDKLLPDMAILDESLLGGLPPALVADSGYDAVSHAVEAFLAKNHTPMSDALAAEALRILFRKLPASYKGDLSARFPVHCASTMAAMAFSQAGLGICHSLSHALGGRFHVPHGRLNAVLLPPVCGVSGRESRLAELGRMAGLDGTSDFLAAKNLKTALIRLRRTLNLPETLYAAGICPGELSQNLSGIAEAALADACTETAPIPVTDSLLKQILREAAG